MSSLEIKPTGIYDRRVKGLEILISPYRDRIHPPVGRYKWQLLEKRFNEVTSLVNDAALCNSLWHFFPFGL